MKLRLVFAGTPQFALPSLRALLANHQKLLAVYTQADRPAGRGRKLTASPIKQLALEHELPVYQPLHFRHPETLTALAALQADLMIVVAYGLLLPPAVLSLPRFGCINVHASLLPRWRGAAPIQRALLAGDEKTGVSIMQMAQGLDTGNVIMQSDMPILATDTSATLSERLAALGATTLLSAVEELAATGCLASQPQDEAQANYASKLTKQEAALDWQRPATALALAVRAYQPWPVAYTYYQGDMLRIWQASAIAGSTQATPGQVINYATDGIQVATGKGILQLERLQLAGGKSLSAADFLHGRARTWPQQQILLG